MQQTPNPKLQHNLISQTKTQQKNPKQSHHPQHHKYQPDNEQSYQPRQLHQHETQVDSLTQQTFHTNILFCQTTSNSHIFNHTHQNLNTTNPYNRSM